jgi:hypothetical protein
MSLLQLMFGQDYAVISILLSLPSLGSKYSPQALSIRNLPSEQESNFLER